MKKKFPQKLKTALRLFVMILAAAVLGANLYSWNASLVSGDSLPMPFGVGAAVVVSGSMEPEISVGDLIIVTKKENYEVNDVIVFQDGRMTVTHRIVAIDEETVTTKGDANNTEDKPIFPAQIKGEVVAVVPLVGYVIDWVKTPVGTLLILGVAIFLTERSFRSDKQKDAEEIENIRAEIEKLKNNGQ